MIGDGLGHLLRIDEVCGLASLAVRCVDECNSRFIENLLELQRVFPILLDSIAIGLDSLKSQGFYSFDRPYDVVLTAPDGAGGAEKNVGIDRVERLMSNRAPRFGWRRQDARGGRRQSGRDELPPIDSWLSGFYRHGHFLPSAFSGRRLLYALGDCEWEPIAVRLY